MEQSSERIISLQRLVDQYNATPGKPESVSCDKCLGKEYIHFLENGYIVAKECACAEINRTLKRIERSGLKDLMELCTFDSYETTEKWQVQAKQKAMDFASGNQEDWFFAGGQIGSGKTHLCTAIVGSLMKQGKSAIYMLWVDEAVKLKAMVTDGEEYTNAIVKLKTIDILYIDDFFKTEHEKRPTAADIRIAFELLNYRYINRNLITIISSERTIDGILDVDESVGSRIYQRSKNHCLIIEQDKSKNFRMK